MRLPLTGDRPRDLLRRALAPGPFARNVALLAGGAAAGQAIVMLASPVLSRLFTPHQFGALAFCNAVVAVFAVVAAFRYDFPILLAEDEDGAASLLGLSLLAVLASTLAAAMAVGLCGDAIVRLLHVPEFRPYLWFLPAMLFGSGLYLVLTYWVTRRRAFDRIAHSKLSQNVLMVLVQIGLGVGGLGAPALLWGATAAPLGGSASLVGRGWRADVAALRRVRPRAIGAAARRFRRFPILGLPAALLNAVGLSLPTLLLAALYDPRVVGWYAFALRVVGRPVEFVATSVTQVFTREAAETFATRPERLPRLMGRVMLGMAAVTVPYALVLALCGPWLFAFVFGGEWRQSGVYVPMLIVGVVAQGCIGPIGDTLEVLQRQDLYLLREVIRLALLAAAAGLALALGLSATVAILCLGIATAIAYVVFLVITLRAVRIQARPLAWTAARNAAGPAAPRSSAQGDHP
jgi:O-antigen/teichoic acid export membrane protein